MTKIQKYCHGYMIHKSKYQHKNVFIKYSDVLSVWYEEIIHIHNHSMDKYIFYKVTMTITQCWNNSNKHRNVHETQRQICEVINKKRKSRTNY